ncbi:MAG: hemolysin III family protein [Bacteroidota bacterium]|nr:hemolysin III family protein [Bacteroidota bacterium]
MVKGSSKSAKPVLGEEIANAVTHGVGALLAIAGLVVLIVFSDGGNLFSLVIYGVTLILLYFASTLYHSLVFTRARNLFRKFDHMAIFLLIAGTYTPFCLTALDGWVRWTLLGVIWTFAIVGIVMKAFFTGKYEWVSITMYILMGWMVVPVIKPIYDALSFQSFMLLVLGGVAYTIGTFFYMNRRISYGHSIWHLWVLAGSILHFFSVLSLA